MTADASPVLLLTPGDPEGIGPEVACRALAARVSAGRPVRAVLVGDAGPVAHWAARTGLDLDVVDTVAAAVAVRGAVAVVDPEGDSEPVEVRAIRAAVDAIGADTASALVTGPINKGRLVQRGFRFRGHTDFLASLCGVERPVMAFVGGQVRVALVTVHLPLRDVPDAVTADAVLHTIRVADAALRDALGLRTRRLVVCGLNPHAGDDGALGHEDRDVVAPAVRRAVDAGIDAVGPVSAEAAFRMALDGHGDLVVAMYHDQGLAPLKALDFGRSVNWTLGLPFVRTSVDHGTAYDIAGRGIADPTSMLAAIELAEQLV